MLTQPTWVMARHSRLKGGKHESHTTLQETRVHPRSSPSPHQDCNVWSTLYMSEFCTLPETGIAPKHPHSMNWSLSFLSLGLTLCVWPHKHVHTHRASFKCVPPTCYGHLNWTSASPEHPRAPNVDVTDSVPLSACSCLSMWSDLTSWIRLTSHSLEWYETKRTQNMYK
jgi:hypothetical protein